MMFRVVALAGLLGLPAGTAWAQGPFDGAWNVIITCTASRDGASGYTLRFPAAVQNGLLHGENGVRGEPAFLSLDGPIAPDGNATLLAVGLTGDPVYTIGRVRPTSPVRYHIQAKFQGGHGTGSRIELRPCEAAFSKV